MLYLSLETLGQGYSRIRPVVRLAAGTLLRRTAGIDPARAFRELRGFVIHLRMIRFEQVATGVPMESPFEPGRVGHRKADSLLTIELHYNEINMVHDRVLRDHPGGRTLAASRDYLDTFVERVESGVPPLVAWCDRKKAWSDRDHYTDGWNAALEVLKRGELDRPYEFTTTLKIRDGLDACWSMVEAEPLESERFEMLAEAYYLLRDCGWQEAQYEADPSREPTPLGQPCKVSNFEANVASSPAPDAGYDYSIA